MNMHDVLAEGGEQVLTVRGDPVEDSTVEQCRTVSEAPLRAADMHSLARKSMRLIPGEAMQRMTFGHSEKSAMKDQEISAGELPKDVGQPPYPGGAVTELGKLFG